MDQQGCIVVDAGRVLEGDGDLRDRRPWKVDVRLIIYGDVGLRERWPWMAEVDLISSADDAPMARGPWDLNARQMLAGNGDRSDRYPGTCVGRIVCADGQLSGRRRQCGQACPVSDGMMTRSGTGIGNSMRHDADTSGPREIV